jgi:16S rRNA (guanine527-N7)-methyltransferase
LSEIPKGPRAVEVSAELQAGIGSALQEFVPANVQSDNALRDIMRYITLLLEANHTVNLVSRKDTQKHLLRFVRESLFLAGALVADAARFPELGRPIRLLDIGTGGGFPGMVVKLALPGIETFLLDATRKKAAFLASVAKDLDLANCSILWARTEDLLRENHQAHRPEFKHGFEWVTTKAVGSLEHSTRLALPFLCVGGAHWTFKGPGLQEELASCDRLFKQTRLQRLQSQNVPGETDSWVVGIRRLAPSESRR